MKIVYLVSCILFFSWDNAMSKNLVVSSSSFKNKGAIPAQYSYKGGNISPQLSWSLGPVGTKSYALVCKDPDAPRAEPWVHWVIVSIPSDITSLVQNASVLNKNIVQGVNDYGQQGWGGPNPPSGIHRYFFTLYALDIVLPSTIQTKKELEQAIRGHILAQGVLMGTYAA